MPGRCQQENEVKWGGQDASEVVPLRATCSEHGCVSVPEDSGRHVDLGIVLALLGRKADAVREGERAIALDPVAKDQLYGF